MTLDRVRTHSDPIWHKAEARRRRAACALLLLLAVGFGLTVLVFYPGYITVDARYVYADAKAWHFGDWQSPAMGVLWRIIDPIAPGSLSMFLLTASLFWLGFGLLAFIALRRSIWLGLLTPLLAFTPPAFFFVGVIWRDVLFGVTWLVGGVLAFAAAERGTRVRIPLQALALFLIAFGVLLRPNAIIAAPLLAIYAIWPMSFSLKRTAIVYAPAAVFFFALVPIVYYGILAAERQNPLHSILVFDLGGITHFSGENQFPVQWSADETALLKSKCYDPARWDSYWYVQPCLFVMRRLERPDDMIFGTPRLVRAWWHAVTTHPRAYIEHRATFTWQFLARSKLVHPNWDWADANSSYVHRTYFSTVIKCTTHCSQVVVSAGSLAAPSNCDRLVVVAAAKNAGGRFCRRGERLCRRLCHELLRARRCCRFPLRLLVCARDACRCGGGRPCCDRQLRGHDLFDRTAIAVFHRPILGGRSGK
jgi:hypothetical protein